MSYSDCYSKYKETNESRDILGPFCPITSRPLSREVFLECGHNPQAAIFDIDDNNVEEKQSFVLDRVKVDASRLENTVIKLDFSSLIFFEAEDKGDDAEIRVELLFELVRSCRGNNEVVQSWRYLKEFETGSREFEAEISEPFSVSFCDRPSCNNSCCEYKMIVKGKDFEGEIEALRVSKPVLTALVQGFGDK